VTFHFPILLLQIGTIVVTARLVGWVFRKIHQPQVMGEMFAGILLGPSLLGWVAPQVSAVLFPVESLGFLDALSQVGLLLFMFLVGLELQPQRLRERGRAAVVTSQASIALPFLSGFLLALFLYPRLSDGRFPLMVFALFMGTAMSITAFPVLARILVERRLLQTRVGTVAIASAAVNDFAGWCVLAIVVLLARSADAGMPVWMTLGGTVAYIAVMVLVVRRLLPWLQGATERRGGVSQGVLAMVVVLVLASAWTTERLGIHALFGAFILGAVMPKDPAFVQGVTEKVHDLTVVLLLPLFFAFVGLRTSLRLLSGLDLWLIWAAILAVAVVGKLGGSAIGARLSGMGTREAVSIGILMNTRGLIELVLLNIGLELGVLSPTLFTMMVLMALATTFMTAPLLEWVYFRRFFPVRWGRGGVAALAGTDETRAAEQGPWAS
jgi:Kef-type K+ transport system membrane component KefB